MVVGGSDTKHYMKRTICRVLNALPEVFYRASDKEFLCRRPEPETPGKVFGSRQNIRIL